MPRPLVLSWGDSLYNVFTAKGKGTLMTRETELLATWLDNVEEADLREELEAMRSDEKAAIEAFHQDLEFGTAGL